MKCFLCNFLRYCCCLLIYTFVATGGTIITTKTTTTKTIITTTTTSFMASNNSQLKNFQLIVPLQQQQQQQQLEQHLSGKKDIKLTKREIDERLQQPFKIMQSIEEEMEPEEHDDDDDDDDDDDEEEEDDINIKKYTTNENDEDEYYDDDDNDDYEENSLEVNENADNDDEEEEENDKANNKRKRQRQRRRRKRKRQKGDKQKRRRKNKKKKHEPLGQPANLLLASLTQLPTMAAPIQHYAHKYKPNKRRRITTTTTTMKPLKYILNKGNLIKKKKQEYLSHLGYVFLPFVKFIAFFTVLNPFTLAVFFFMLISPVAFALLGFTALSLILRPAMNLLFAVKHRIGNINRNNRRYHQKQQQQQHKRKYIASTQRPITIHKHFYPQPTATHAPIRQQPHPNLVHHAPLFLRRPTRPLFYHTHAHTHSHPHSHPHRSDIVKDISFHNSTEVNGLVNVQQTTHQHFNPLLPQVRQQLKQIQPPIGLQSRKYILPSL